MIQILISILTTASAHAIVMEPTFQAADSLGYQIVGEIEFTKDSFKIPPRQIEKQISEIGEMCPRTQAHDPKISSFARFIILAWSDMDYPKSDRQYHSAHQQWLAHKRALSIAEKIRSDVRGNLNFEMVNMANRKEHLVENVATEPSIKPRQNIKDALEMAGAAPSDPLGFGLFAEYSQAAKAVIWVDCSETMVKRRGSIPHLVQLAANGAIR